MIKAVLPSLAGIVTLIFTPMLWAAQDTIKDDHVLAPASQLLLTDVSARSGASPDVGRTARALLRSGDVVSARKLLPYCAMHENSELAGLIAARSEKPDLAAAKREAQALKYSDQDKLIKGLAVGLAQQGRHDEAIAAAKLDPDSVADTRALLVRFAPTKQNVEALSREIDLKKVYGTEFFMLVEACIIAGDDARADELVRNALARTSGATEFAYNLQQAQINGYIQAGNPAKAEELAKSLTKGQWIVQTRLARAPALAGDVAAVTACLQSAKEGSTRVEIADLLAYAHARSGNLDEARKLANVAAPKNYSSNQFAVRYGMIAGARKAAGDDAGARAAIDEGVAKIRELPEASARIRACSKLILAAVLGADYYSYDAGHTDMW